MIDSMATSYLNVRAGIELKFCLPHNRTLHNALLQKSEGFEVVESLDEC